MSSIKNSDVIAPIKAADAELYSVYRLANKKDALSFVIPLEEVTERNNNKTILCKTIRVLNDTILINRVYYSADFLFQAVNIEKDKEWKKTSSTFELQKKKKIEAATLLASGVTPKKKRGRKKKDKSVITKTI